MFLSSTSHSSSLLHCFSHLNTWNKSSHPTCILYSLSPTQCFQFIYSSRLSFLSKTSPKHPLFLFPPHWHQYQNWYNATVIKSTPSAPPTIVEKSHQLNIARLFSSDIIFAYSFFLKFLWENYVWNITIEIPRMELFSTISNSKTLTWATHLPWESIISSLFKLIWWKYKKSTQAWANIKPVKLELKFKENNYKRDIPT